MDNTLFFNRDLSWLAFNERVLMEASRQSVPLKERMNFLAIYSSNLDEFYRVRVPSLMALSKIESESENHPGVDYDKLLQLIKETVQRQLSIFGEILTKRIFEPLKAKGIHVIYNEPIPDFISEYASEYFFNHVLGYLQPVVLENDIDFFPENNKLYSLAVLSGAASDKITIINIPSEQLSRFLVCRYESIQYIIFLEDIIKANLHWFFKNVEVKAVYNFKITRDAEIELQDEYEEDVVEKLEKQIARRDFGFATRLLHDEKIPAPLLRTFIKALHLEKANVVAGGSYHNLKDLSSMPLEDASLFYEKWKPITVKLPEKDKTLLENILLKDIILHTPYQSYDPVLRFFNEAAADESVEEIYVTLYRVAQQSKIADALISAAKNGKKVTVLVELKARFDESNNIKWSKKMKSAGIDIHYSSASLKIHAKIALLKKRKAGKSVYLGLMATGNLNEVTARFYTDHILLSSNPLILRELDKLFKLLTKKKTSFNAGKIHFSHLLVARFNMKEKFMELFDREIANAKQGLLAFVTIKLNNLEEKSMISKLYEASNAGVKINLIVRGVCCLVPGLKGISENITIRRIVDRYLEHGRVFIFHNNGYKDVFLGSADWMSRNIYRRIEVCFPVYDEKIKKELIDMVDIQLLDNVQAVMIDVNLQNIPFASQLNQVQSQRSIFQLLSNRAE